MKYSIIIPVLNEEKLLPNLLKQLHNIKNKWEDVEIILSDGGSNDRTIEFAMKYCDIIKIHDKTFKQNIAMGRNEGAKFASGEILIFLNGDVVLRNEENFIYFIENNFINSDYLAMTCFVKVFPEDEILIDKLYHAGYNSYFNLLNKIGIGMGRGECQIIKKDIFNKLNGYNENLAAGEDFDLYRRVRRIGNILYTNKLIVYESPRRYRKLGYSGVTWSGIKNGFSVLIKNRSISKEWEQVR